MGIFNRIFSRQKTDHERTLSFSTIQNARDISVEDDSNPPFSHLNDNFSLDVNKYSEIADIFIDYAVVMARGIQEGSSFKANDHLVHFCFDLILVNNSGRFHQDSRISSAIVDGIHFKYFGQPSQNVIASQMQMLAEQERCFLVSLMLMKNEDKTRLLPVFAHFCISEDGFGLGATEALSLSTLIINLSNEISAELKAKISSLL